MHRPTSRRARAQQRFTLALSLGLGLILALLLASAPASAQSCILTRLDSPVVDAFDPSLALSLDESRWEVSFAWRYGHADRHFVGTEEQTERRAENSQVENDVHLLDVGLRYRFSKKTDLALGIPYLMARREGPIRDENRQLIGRQVRSNTRGIGDITLVANHLIFDPGTHPRGNIGVGGGIKLPTGENSAHDTLLVLDDNGELVPEVRTADQSVQPGDGGFGFILQASAFRVLDQQGRFAIYGSATYIIEPETDSGVYTYRSRPGEEIMSIADQYAARLGFQVAFGQSGWSAGLGARLEGIPVHDLFGSSDGFRRPGYILSAEPSANWTRGANSLSFSIPIAIQRNRQASVPDIRNGTHGDASFPDYIVLVGYSRRF
jgi:hypothetical protein